MGERMTGSHEVRGSIPRSSTQEIKGLQQCKPFSFGLMGHFWDTFPQQAASEKFESERFCADKRVIT
jgi:hypothetical protein